MANKGSGNSAGTSAGQVYVSLRADLSQLEADLNKAKGMVAGTAKTGTTGVAGGADVIVAAKAQATAQDTIAASATRSSAAISQVGFASREAARDVRMQVATIKDQLNDTTAFSGAGFSDLLFGIDNDRIATTRFGGALADLQKQKVKLDAELIRDPGNKALVQNLFEVNKQIKVNQDGLDGIQKKWSGLGGAARGAAATVATSLASSFLIGAGIGIAVAALQTLLEAGGYMIEKLVNPTKATAAAFNDLASAIKAVGGLENFAALVRGDSTLINLGQQAELATTMAKSSDTLAKLFGAGSSAGATGATATESVLRSGEEAARKAAQQPYQNFFGLMDYNALGPEGERKIRESAKNLGGDAVKWISDEISRGIDPYDALGNVAARRYRELMAPPAAGAMPPSSQYEAGSLLRQRALLSGQPLPYGALAAPSQQETLQTQIAALRAQQTALGNSGTYASIARALNDASLGVARAGVSGGQETVFDVAIRRSEALENLKRAREDAARQRASIYLQTKIADKSTKLDNLTKLESIDKRLAELVAQFGSGFMIDTGATPPTKDETAKAVYTLNTWWVGRQTRLIPRD